MLNNPESRRGLRSIIQAVVVLVLLYFVWRWVKRLEGDALLETARWALGIIALGTFGYIMENTTRAFKLSAGADGLHVESEGEAAQVVADAAQDKADEVKG